MKSSGARSSFAKRERSLAEQVIIVILLGCLMASFLYRFFEQESELTKVAFDSVSSQFVSQVTAIRAQWFMEKQPNKVYISNNNKENIGYWVEVNQDGWLASSSDKISCEQIWQWVMRSELVFMKQPISVFKITKTKNIGDDRCRYQLASGEYFEYWPNTGKVSEVKKV